MSHKASNSFHESHFVHDGDICPARRCGRAYEPHKGRYLCSMTNGALLATATTICIFMACLPSTTGFQPSILPPWQGVKESRSGSTFSPNSIQISENMQRLVIRNGASRAKQALTRVSMCSTLPVSFAMIEGIGRSLPAVWFKMLGVPSPDIGSQLFFLASNASYFMAAVRYSC
jgi:hypothetical protein